MLSASPWLPWQHPLYPPASCVIHRGASNSVWVMSVAGRDINWHYQTGQQQWRPHTQRGGVYLAYNNYCQGCDRVTMTASSRQSQTQRLPSSSLAVAFIWCWFDCRPAAVLTQSAILCRCWYFFPSFFAAWSPRLLSIDRHQTATRSIVTRIYKISSENFSLPSESLCPNSSNIR